MESKILSGGIKLIVGLGNPGQQYAKTRHNIGFWLVDFLAKKYQVDLKFESKFNSLLGDFFLDGSKVTLLKPQTFMNLSGEAVAKAVKFYKIMAAEILVAHDELDFLPCQVRLKCDGGANGHNGLQNIIDLLGGGDFWRLRIGIGKPINKDGMTSYVLNAPTKDESQKIEDAISLAADSLPELIKGDFERAFMRLHVDKKI